MADDRITMLCAQSVLTGIDFVSVEDPTDQTVLRVYFLLNPPGLDTPWVADPDVSSLRIWAPSGGRTVVEPTITAATWTLDESTGRKYLAVTVDEPGDFSIYRFSIDHAVHGAVLDYFFSSVEFSFKQACPSTLDCKLVVPDDSCAEPDDGLELNPLARDFVSLRRALIDLTSQRYPDWTYRGDADVGVMLLELMAALGDEFNYIKDRYAREGVLDELSQRRSLRMLTRLLDYELHEGRSGTTVLVLDVAAGKTSVSIDAGTKVWTNRFGQAPIAFEVGEGIVDYHSEPDGLPKSFDMDISWNTLTVHEPDAAKPQLAKGATEMFLVGSFGALTWEPNRMIVLHEDPSDGSAPRRHLVHVTEVEETSDPLHDVTVTRVVWDESEALPCPMTIADMTVKANVVHATAGESFEEFFWIRGDGSHPDAVERQGPLDANTGTRNPIMRYSPINCETLGLAWLGELDSARPEIEVQTVEVELEHVWDEDAQWTWQPTMLDSLAEDRHFTLENGTWRRIVGYRLAGGTELVHRDWAANAGYTLRFGDGEFGQIPGDEVLFRVRYRSGPGSDSNVNADTITYLYNPLTESPPVGPDFEAVTNPFAVTDGVDPEHMQRAKFLAPIAFQHETLNAVTPEDYERIAKTLTWVQQASATVRWTGAWLTIFVAADPLGAFSTTAEQRAELEDLMDCARQVGRDVHVLEPDYIDLDLRITLCPTSGAYPGKVEAAVREALTGEGGFFDPDAFTFGTPLRRSALEARLQRVPGVRVVERIDIRARELKGWAPFSDVAFEVGAEQIIRVANDPTAPERGTVTILVRELV